MSRPQSDDGGKTTVIKPWSDALNILLNADMQGAKSAYASIEPVTSPEMIDSAAAFADTHIQGIVRDLRERLKKRVADVHILLYGTDTMADLVTACGNGIAARELGDQTVILTCSMQHLDESDSDAFGNFRSSLIVGAMQEARGKMGLLVNQRFFPPRGIEKTNNNLRFPFLCRFPRIAKFEDDKWNFRGQLECDIPRGELGKEYRLVQGVEEFTLTATSNYGNLPRAIMHNKGTVLIAPGSGNVRTDTKSVSQLRRAAQSAHGPIVLVGAAIESGEDEPLTPDEDANYATHAGRVNARIISAMHMGRTEARILLSQIIAKAEGAGLDKEQTFELAESTFKLHPFNAQASKL